MWPEKMKCFRKLMKKATVMGRNRVQPEPSRYELLAGERDDSSPQAPPSAGFFPVYVGEKRERFVVPIGFLSHPLFRMLLEKTYDEFGYEQRNGLVVSCDTNAFREIVAAVGSGRRQFEFGKFVEEFI
ncbi:hypothetical protein NMG60_11001473 [Bertholletia excelsa]